MPAPLLHLQQQHPQHKALLYLHHLRSSSAATAPHLSPPSTAAGMVLATVGLDSSSTSTALPVADQGTGRTTEGVLQNGRRMACTGSSSSTSTTRHQEARGDLTAPLGGGTTPHTTPLLQNGQGTHQEPIVATQGPTLTAHRQGPTLQQ